VHLRGVRCLPFRVQARRSRPSLYGPTESLDGPAGCALLHDGISSPPPSHGLRASAVPFRWMLGSPWYRVRPAAPRQGEATTTGQKPCALTSETAIVALATVLVYRHPLQGEATDNSPRLGAPATEELKELVRQRDRLKQDFDDRVRQLHRLVDLGFPSSPATSVRSTASWPPPSSPTTRPRRRSPVPRRTVWPSCATTAGTRSGSSSPASWSRPPSARSASTTGRRTGSRSRTFARTSTSGAGASRRARATSSGCSRTTRSAACSPRLTASAP
jgi:hypothetical protein